MSVELSFGGVCRDIDKLPQGENEFRAFFDDFISPAIYDDFRKNFVMALGQGGADARAFPAELEARGCEVSGSVSIRF